MNRDERGSSIKARTDCRFHCGRNIEVFVIEKDRASLSNFFHEVHPIAQTQTRAQLKTTDDVSKIIGNFECLIASVDIKSKNQGIFHRCGTIVFIHADPWKWFPYYFISSKEKQRR
ncbi:hypothetical protein D3C87_1678710 [compost metagenome]